MKTDCRHTRQLLPWLINGTLEGSERTAVREHLAACGDCRSELGKTWEVWQITTRHVPSLALAEYAQGLKPTAMTSESIERHLAVCASCREELGWAASDRVLDFEAARERRPAPTPVPGNRWRWRQAALAAGLAALVSSAGFLWSRGAGPQDPAGGLAATEREAAGLRQAPADPRSAGDGAQRSAALFSNGFEEGGLLVWSASASGTDSIRDDIDTL